jgi:glycosyltransferase involved in cell wall biosynthesis
MLRYLRVSDLMTDTTLPLIVICPGTGWDAVAMHADRMLANELFAHARILWVDPPLSPITPSHLRFGTARHLVPRLDRPRPGLIVLRSLALPLHTRPGVRHSTPALTRAQIRWALRRLRERPAAVIDCRLGRLLGGWGLDVRNVLYGTDDYVAGAELMGRDAAHIRRDEEVTLANADLVIAVSQQLADRWRGMGATVEFIANGVAVEAYTDVDAAEPALDVDLPRPVVGVVGQLTDRIDISLLEAVVDSGLSLLMVGPRDPRWEPERFERLIAAPHVQWVGLKPFAALPGYLRLMDVGITPYQDTSFNRASFPLKTLEYLAAGRAVVSSDLPATRWLRTDLVRVASGPVAFASAVLEAAAEPRTPELMRARRAVAARHSWRARADQAAKVMGLLPDQVIAGE